jgi:hypothetical protein
MSRAVSDHPEVVPSLLPLFTAIEDLIDPEVKRDIIVVCRLCLIIVKARDADAGLIGKLGFGNSQSNPTMPVGCR